MRLNQQWKRPSSPLPIVIIGPGGIVRDGHLPAYAKAGFQVAGLFDIDAAQAHAVAEQFSIDTIYETLEDATSIPGVVFDVAVPPERIMDVLPALPAGATVLIQKPMGSDLANARAIREICRENKLVAAVNFQLRFSPMMLAVADAIEQGLLGEIVELEVRLNLRTPWEMFPFLRGLPRVEILVHSVHYLDWIRSLLGEPHGVYARTVADPRVPELAGTRTSAILDYGERVRCCLSLNHNADYGPKHTAATVKVEGMKGTAIAKLGLLLNYPEGEPDELEIKTDGDEWTAVPLEGRWFPDAFIGTMSSLQRYAVGEDDRLPTSVEDAYKTMALVEACYQSNAGGGTPIPE